jgi:hypothetical protein
MFNTNTNTEGSKAMTRDEFSGFSDISTVAGTVTLLVSGWLFLAAATVVASPTDAQVARASSVSVKTLGVMPTPQPPQSVAIAPEARLTIVVHARRA